MTEGGTIIRSGSNCTSSARISLPTLAPSEGEVEKDFSLEQGATIGIPISTATAMEAICFS